MKLFLNIWTALFILTGWLSAQETLPKAASPEANVDARQILQNAAEACLKIKNIEYREEQFHTDHQDDQPFLTATVRQGRANVPEMGFLPGKFLVEGLTGNQNREMQSFAFSYNGAAFRILEAAEKIIRVVKTPTPYIAGQVLAETGGAMVGIPQFTQDSPFQTLLEKGENFTYEGTRLINDEECDVVSVTQTFEHPAFGARTSASRWFISRRDRLPKGNETGDVQRRIRILKINDAPTDYFIPIREGYGEKLITGRESRGKGLLAVGSIAPDWTLLDAQGRSHSLGDYRGRIVLMDFWGTWCAPCWQTMPGVQRLYEKFRAREVVVFGISVGDKELDPAGFMRRKGYTYNLLPGGDRVAEIYQAVTLPTIYLIGFDGEIIHAEYGYRENAEAEIAKIIEGYLKVRKR